MSNFARALARKKAKKELKEFKKQNGSFSHGLPLSTWMNLRPNLDKAAKVENEHVHTEDCVHEDDGKEFLE